MSIGSTRDCSQLRCPEGPHLDSVVVLQGGSLPLTGSICCLASERGSLPIQVRRPQLLGLPSNPILDDLFPHQLQLPALFLQQLLLVLLCSHPPTGCGISGSISLWRAWMRRMEWRRWAGCNERLLCQDALHPAWFTSAWSFCSGRRLPLCNDFPMRLQLLFRLKLLA